MASNFAKMKQAAIASYDNGNYGEAFFASCMAFKDKSADRQTRLIFTSSLEKGNLQAAQSSLQFNPVVKNAILRTLEANDVDAQKLFDVWFVILKLDPSFKILFTFKTLDYTPSSEDWASLESCISDPFLIEGLRKLINTDRTFEVCLRNIRKLLLLKLLDKGILKTKHLEFICALAEQCHNSEYIYLVTDEEKQVLETLTLDDPITIAIAACYEVLYGKEVNQKASAVALFRKLIQTQIKEPEREAELKKTITTVNAITNDVSGKVRGMYEENPYPRWRSIDVPVYPDRTLTGDILIAGCGTGRYGIQLALQLSNVSIQAVDLTLSSLAYAERMREVYKVDNITHSQCDILDVGKLNKQFDLINSSGVLHHMADPMAGWKSLLSVLNPGGVMSIGLYSTIARAIVRDAWEEIQKGGYKSDSDGIRQFREDVFLNQGSGKCAPLTTFGDFYTLSNTRDLLFHVQEATYTILELKKMLDDLGLEFLGFNMVPPAVANFFRQTYPDDPKMLNLDNWNDLEQRIPNAFIRMYNFTCKRAGEPINATTQKFLETGLFS